MHNIGFLRTPQPDPNTTTLNPFPFLTDPENAPEPTWGYCQGTGCGPGSPEDAARPRSLTPVNWMKENSGLLLAGAAGVFVLAMIAGGRRR